MKRESCIWKPYNSIWILFIVFISTITVGGCSNTKTENKEQKNELAAENENKYKEIKSIIDNEKDVNKLLELYKEACLYTTSISDKKDVKSHIINLNEQLENYDEALKLLDEYEKEFEEQKCTIIHRAELFKKKALSYGDLNINQYYQSFTVFEQAIEQTNLFWQAENQYEKALNKRNVAPKYNWFTMQWNSDYDISKAYIEYFFNYLCDMLAILYKASLYSDPVLGIQQAERFFTCAPQFEEVLASYYKYRNDLKKKYSNHLLLSLSTRDLSLNTEINLLANYQLGYNCHYWSFNDFYDFIEDIKRMRWNSINMFLYNYDMQYGYESTRSKMQILMKDYQIEGGITKRYFLDTYMALADSVGRKSKIPYDILLSLANKEIYDYVTILSPTTIDGELSSFIKAGITGPRILLRCNDWVFSDFNDFTSETVASYKGEIKKIVLLSDNYDVDTIQIYADKLGVSISKIKVDPAFFNLLLYDFDYSINQIDQK